MKKRSFILLEILIAISLISICIIPLIRNPIYFYKKEIKCLEKLERTRIKKEALLEIQEMLFKNHINWDDFAEKSRKKALIKKFEQPKKIEIKDFAKKEIEIYYRIWTKKEKFLGNDSFCRKVAIQISLDNRFKKSNYCSNCYRKNIKNIKNTDKKKSASAKHKYPIHFLFAQKLPFEDQKNSEKK